MKKQAAAEIKKRIEAVRVDAGLKTFKEVPTEVAKVEQLPACFMLYGPDSIVKRSTRSASPSRAGIPDIRSAEILIEIIGNKSDDVFSIYKQVRTSVLADVYPVKDVNGVPEPSTFMLEDRTEGPIGYGLPGVEAMVFVISLVYPDL